MTDSDTANTPAELEAAPQPEDVVVFPDWSQAVRLAEVKVQVFEAIGPLTEAYGTNHRDGPVFASPGQYLLRPVDDPAATTCVDSIDGYSLLEPVDPAPVDGEAGVCRMVGEALVLEGDDAQAFLAAFGQTPDVSDPFAGHVGGPAVDVAAIDPADGIVTFDPADGVTGEDAASETPADDAPVLEEKP